MSKLTFLILHVIGPVACGFTSLVAAQEGAETLSTMAGVAFLILFVTGAAQIKPKPRTNG